MKNSPLPIILLVCSAVALAGCSEPPALATPFQVKETNSAQYDVLDVSSSDIVGSVEVTSKATPDVVTQDVRMTFLGTQFEFTSYLDPVTGSLESWDDANGTTFAAGVEAQAPSLGRNLFPEVSMLPVTRGFYGLPWAAVHLEAQGIASAAWGYWNVTRQPEPRGFWINATAACDAFCGPNTPVWQTSYLLSNSLLPLEVVLASDADPGYRLLARFEPVASGAPLNAVEFQAPVELLLSSPDDACLPIPCEGPGLPSEFAFAHAFQALQDTLEWQQWSTGKTPRLQMLSVARVYQSETLGTPAPLLGTHWGFVFQSEQGDEAIFFLRSLRMAEVWTPPVLLDSSIAPASNFDLTTTERHFAAADVAATTMVQQASWTAPEEFSLLLSVTYGKLTPNPILQIVWDLVDFESGGTTLASGHDGRLLGVYPSGVPSPRAGFITFGQ